MPIEDKYLNNKLFLVLLAISSSNAWAAIVGDDSVIIPYNTSYIIDVLANDQDDSLDAVLANQGAPNQLCLGDDTGVFSCEDINVEHWHSLAVSLGDVNQDNDLDAVFANGDNQENRICLGRGDGRFEHPCAVISAEGLWSHDVALGDVNDDAQLDALFANFKQGEIQKHQLCLGHGQGSFICEPFEADEFPGMGIALGTLDNDSELDVIFATYGRANSICLGDAQGHFTPCVAVDHDAAHSLDVALGDIDADHYPDAVFANGDNQRNQICFGNGSTNWPDCEPVSADLVSTEAVALGDLNADGRLDIVFANSILQPNHLCLQNPTTSRFDNCMAVSSDALNTQGLALGDVNGDGPLDILFANAAHSNQVCLNDGRAHFSCHDISSRDSEDVALGFLGLDNRTMALIDSPLNGTARLEADGSISYTPKMGFSGLDHFTYSIEGKMATVTVEVQPPVAENLKPASLLLSTVPLPPNASVSIYIKGTGQGTVSSEPPGLLCDNIPDSPCTHKSDFLHHCLDNGGDRCRYRYPTATWIQLIPIAAPGAQFQYWGGHPDCRRAEQLFLLHNVSCIAYFKQGPQPASISK